jgi:hypothetical protein
MTEITKLNFNTGSRNMKVKCIQIINRVTGEKQEKSNYLTVGKVYVVLSVGISKREMFVRLNGNDLSPGLFSIDNFEIIDNSLPSNWRIDNDNGFVTLAPEKWQVSGFWERFYDDEIKEMEDFRTECEIIFKESA